MARARALGLAVLMVSACSSGQPPGVADTSTTTTVVSQSPAPSSLSSTVSPSCVADDLRVSRATFGGAGLGSSYWSYDIINEGQMTCVLGTAPFALTAIASNGDRVQLDLALSPPVSLTSKATTRLLLGAANACSPDAYSLATDAYQAPALELVDGSLLLGGAPLIVCGDRRVFASFEPADD